MRKSRCVRPGADIFAFVLLRDFAGPIDFVCVDIFTQIFFQAAEEFLPSGAVFSALLRVRMDAPEIVAADEKIAGETAPIVEWIARGFRQLERFAFAFRHFRSVDDGRLWG